MKKFPARSLILPLSFLFLTEPVFAGGLCTPGQGARALSMAEAFTAVADDGSAIYYNPAGISQIPGTSVEATVAFLSPKISYTTLSNATEISNKRAVAPSFFMTHRYTDKFTAGVGVYAPYARDAEMPDDLSNGFAFQRAKMLRTDFSAVVSYQVSDTFSMGGGLVFGYSKLDRSIPSGSTTRIIDKMDGLGTGAIVGLLWKVNDRLKAGLTYRTEMLVEQDGTRTIVTGGHATTSNARAAVRYPASLGLGLDFSPSKKLSLALDVDWHGWSSMDQVTVKTDIFPDSTTQLNARDTLDIRIGGEYKLPSGWALRAGYAYAQGAFPTDYIIPVQPDGDGYEIGLGIGRTEGAWRLDLAYHYAFIREASTSTNIYGYNGKYNINQHLVGLTAAYRF